MRGNLTGVGERAAIQPGQLLGSKTKRVLFEVTDQSPLLMAYASAETITVLWCPTIDDQRFQTAGFFRGQEGLDWTWRLARARSMEILEAYFDAFGELKAAKQSYRELFSPIADAVARYCCAKGGSVRFADLARPNTYAEIVERVGLPVRAHPSFGFWFDLDGDSNISFSLGFQIEATYDRRAIDSGVFWDTCVQFLDQCGQSALRVLMGSSAWDIGRKSTGNGSSVYVESAAETVWKLDLRPSGRIVPQLARDRLRYELTGAARAEPANERWRQQATLRMAAGAPRTLGATLVVPLDDSDVLVRVSGYSHWLFEAMFPTVVARAELDPTEPPDPVLMSAEHGKSKDDPRPVRCAMYQPEPAGDHCLCGDNYPAHSGRPSVVALRKRAESWIVAAYTRPDRRPLRMDWNMLSSPRTYFASNPEVTFGSGDSGSSGEEARAGADLVWRHLLNTVFEAAPLQTDLSTERESLSMRSECAACKQVCCHSGSPLVSAAERSQIVDAAGFEDFFVPAGDSSAFWIGRRRDGEIRRKDAKTERMLDSCPYYDVGEGCLIQKWKPMECVMYPFRIDREGKLRTSSSCPSNQTFTVASRATAERLGELGPRQSTRELEMRQLYAGSWNEILEDPD